MKHQLLVVALVVLALVGLAMIVSPPARADVAPDPFNGDSTLATATIGQPYSYRFVAPDPQALFYMGEGSLPPGLTLSRSGVLAGTPTTAAYWPFRVIYAGPLGSLESCLVTIPVIAAAATPTPTPTATGTPTTSPVFTAFTPPAGRVGQPYAYQFAAQGALSYSTWGTLPSGLTLTSAGMLAGAPALAGAFHFFVIANGTGGHSTFQVVTVTVTS